jgi:hypothetical protein
MVEFGEADHHTGDVGIGQREADRGLGARAVAMPPGSPEAGDPLRGFRIEETADRSLGFRRHRRLQPAAASAGEDPSEVADRTL